jgi:hypothetical protein
MNKHPFFRYKKAVLFFVAVGLIISFFTGRFKQQNELTLFGVENNVAVYEYATFKKIK